MFAGRSRFRFDRERVKWIRIRLGETQSAFARRIGVETNMVCRWEAGAVPTQARILKALLEAEKEAEG